MQTDLTPAEKLFVKGNQYMAEGAVDDAEICFRQALALAPNFAEALANLAWLREHAGAVADAETYYRQAMASRPDGLQIYLNLGALLLQCKRFAEAEVVNRQAVQRAPESPAAWSNLGVLLACMKREQEAEQCYREALWLDDAYAKARFNLGYILLRQGRLDEGWPCLEARSHDDNLTVIFTCPRWRGESLVGKSIVLGFEGGHGDMIHFCRYTAVLKAMGAARITIVCHPGLKRLFESLTGVDQLISFDEDIPNAGWDFWTPPMSLPFYCQTRLDNIPVAIPYLAVDAVDAARWSSLLPASGLRIGLAWKGNPHFENDADRSLPSLDTLAPLANVTGVQFVSLQKGPGEVEVCSPPPGLSILGMGSQLQDFADTAALVSTLDLVISVDTAVAHLAGALGKPCWVLLPDYRTDWRWLTARADSPWYPVSMRLFRQTLGGSWDPVILAVRDALESWKVQMQRSGKFG